MQMIKNYISGLLLIGSFLPVFLAACSQGESKPVNAGPGKDATSASKDAGGKAGATGGGSAPASPYIIGEVGQGQLGSSVSLPAVLKPFERVDIYPKVNGFIKEIPVDRGSQVRQGQLLLRLEAPEIEQQYYAAKAKYLQVYAYFLASKDNYDRLLVANRMPGTVSAHDLELARAKMMADSATAQGEIANYTALGATKDYLRVTAPFDGVITERNAHPGALVGPAQKAEDRPIMVLEQQSKLRLVIEVPEIYSNQLSGRSLVQFRVSTLPGKSFNGKISRSSGSLNMKYRSETIEVDVSNTDHLLKPGMYAEVELPVIRNTLSLIVPGSAIITSTEKRYVIMVRENKAHWVDVTEGNSRNDSTEIFGDLHWHDKVIVNANDEIKEGTTVQ
ncbi:MAG TPA: efflux RND transporter periplasmic adaptor subunit [Puia sp.]|nr:efflux RND transporter periplasmic adaptor subunit [Puia sp.]